MRPPPRRVARLTGRIYSVARGALGYRRPAGQSWPHPTVPIPVRVRTGIEKWMEASGITDGALFRSIDKRGRVWGNAMTPKVLWEIVRKPPPEEQIFQDWLRTISGEPVLDCAILPAENWIRFNFYWGTSQSRQPSILGLQTEATLCGQRQYGPRALSDKWPVQRRVTRPFATAQDRSGRQFGGFP